MEEKLSIKDFDIVGIITLNDVDGIEKYVTPVKHEGKTIKYLSRSKEYYNVKSMTELALEREELKAKLTRELTKKNFVILENMLNCSGKVYFKKFEEYIMGKKDLRSKIQLQQAEECLMEDESDKLIDNESVHQEAIRRAEEEGIIFIDEMDKIIGKGSQSGPDVSREGVQRDILPIVEGSTVSTKYGNVKTDFILFIAAGAFHVSKIEDMIPELQGRFPIRVELNSLTKDDFVKILSTPKNAITLQYASLLKVDNIDLEFTDDALDEIAIIAEYQNENMENLGARRLHTIMEKLLEDVSFNASGEYPLSKVIIDRAYVQNIFGKHNKNSDLKKYII